MPRFQIDRRTFLKLTGSSASLALPRGVSAYDAEPGSLSADRTTADPIARTTILRPRDLLNVEIEFENLALVSRWLRTPRLEAVSADRPALLVVTLPPQHVLEQRSLVSEAPPDLPVQAFLSAATRLVFRVPDELLPLLYSTESLLRWSEFELVRRPDGEPLCEPQRETAIEFPSRLAFVPDGIVRFDVARTPRVAQGRTELWRARLAEASLRSIWTPDHQDSACPPNTETAAPPFDAPLQADRVDIALSARGPTPAHPGARPVSVRDLALSPLGAWADIRGAWDPPVSGDLVEWENRSTMGRDHRVKVARLGFLYPWGHQAVLVELTEREILTSPDPAPGERGPDAAYLRVRLFLAVTQPHRTYPDPASSPDLGHPKQCFRTVDFITTKTPSLDAYRPLPPPAPPVPDGDINGHGREAFWPKVGGEEFRFEVSLRDWSGRISTSNVTAIFIGFTAAGNPGVLADIESAYQTETSSKTGTPVPRSGLRTSLFRGQSVAFAREREAEDTTVETSDVTFTGERRPSAPPGDREFPFSAVIDAASVRIPSVARFAGFEEVVKVAYDDRFDPSRPEANPAEIFLKVTNAPHLDFDVLGADKSGGMATPSLMIGAISRTSGPVGADVEGLAADQFRPEHFFPEDAKLLGGVKMGDVLEAMRVSELDKPDKAGTSPIVPFCDATRSRQTLPTFSVGYRGGRLCAGLDLETTKLKSFVPVFEIGEKPCLRVQTTVCFSADEVDFAQQRGRLEDVKFIIPKTILFHFHFVDFERNTGRPLRVDAKLKEVQFLDALRWLVKLVEAIKKFVKGLFGGGPGGIGDLFELEVTPIAAKLTFGVKLPKLELGALAIQNIRMAIGAELGLLGGDGFLLLFEFSDRKDPFSVTVTPFSGGGFFGLGFVTDELRRVEAAIEFGGRFAIGIFGARGEAFLMAGVYYAMKVEDGRKRQELVAYLRAGGSLKVIELVRVSVEFYMALVYVDSEGSLCGEATVVVEISLLFFSASVDLTFRKCFKGGEEEDGVAPEAFAAATPPVTSPAVEPRPLRFRDAVNGSDGWQEYWAAFAA
jgi:hypothetical protein